MTTQTKQTHTPGPWIFESYPSYTKVWSDEKGRSAEIATMTPRGEFEHIANARLIAAAPELLAACDVAQRYLGLIKGELNRVGDIDWNAIYNQLRSAMKKARGE